VKRLQRIIWAILFSRATPPVVIGFFLLGYVGIAFITDETLIALMRYTRTSFFLTAMLALLPLNFAVRLVVETIGYLKIRRVVTVSTEDVSPGLFDETVELAVTSSFEKLQSHLETLGYKTRRIAGALGAWRGISIFPARILFVAGVFCLYAGILISLTSRTSERVAIVEGEKFSSSTGESGIVERITFEPSSGLILAKKLSMEVAPSSGKGKNVFGVYPPSLYQGAFVYPRYLGIGLFFNFSAPGLPARYETFSLLNIYPPGKEATSVIPGSTYRLVFSLAGSDDETDPYTTGRMNFNFKLLKGKDLVLTGSAPRGGAFVRDGYRIAFPDSRRLVITDFIRDYGVLLIWASGILFVVAGCFWLPVRIFFPRSELLFRSGPDRIQAFSRSEGRGRKHGEIFHEALDLLEMRGTDRKSFD
jgi:hypothetical protein